MNANITKTIIVSVTVIVIAIIIYLMVRNTYKPVDHPDEQEAVTCGNKQIYRYKYPNEAFPIFTRDYNTEVSLTSDVLKKISDSLGNTEVGVDAKNQVVELQEKLNQDNITFTTALRSYFMNVNADPCNDTLRQKYIAFTDEMSNRMMALKSATEQVTVATKETGSKPADTTIHVSSNPADTSQNKLSKVIVRKDSASVTKSIFKLNQLLQKNNRFNSMIRVMPLRVPSK